MVVPTKHLGFPSDKATRADAVKQTICMRADVMSERWAPYSRSQIRKNRIYIRPRLAVSGRRLRYYDARGDILCRLPSEMPAQVACRTHFASGLPRHSKSPRGPMRHSPALVFAPAASSFGYAQRPVHPPPAACPPFFPFTQLLAVTGAETHAILQSPSSTIRSNLSTQSADRMTCSSSLKVPGFIAHFRPPLTSACSSLLCGYCAVCATRFDSQSGTKAVCPPRSLARGKERQATKRHFRATTT